MITADHRGRVAQPITMAATPRWWTTIHRVRCSRTTGTNLRITTIAAG
jgi:hypothetical protein